MPNALQEMTSQERFARAFLTLKSALGVPAAWDFWKRLSDPKPAGTLAKGDAKATEKLLKSTFADAWTAAAPNAKTKKAKLAAKKTPAQVCVLVVVGCEAGTGDSGGVGACIAVLGWATGCRLAGATCFSVVPPNRLVGSIADAPALTNPLFALLYCCCPHIPALHSQAWADLQSGSGYSSEAGMQLSDMSNYLISKGLAHLPKPMWWLNGLLSDVPEGGHTSVDSAVGFAVMTEMQALQEHVYFGRLDDEQSVVESLLEMHQSVKRWNPRVLPVGDNVDEAQKVRRGARCGVVLCVVGACLCVTLVGVEVISAAAGACRLTDFPRFEQSNSSHTLSVGDGGLTCASASYLHCMHLFPAPLPAACAG